MKQRTLQLAIALAGLGIIGCGQGTGYIVKPIPADESLTETAIASDGGWFLSDKIAVMNEGRLIQVGSAQELYARPINPWVANFVGTANLIEGEIGEQTERGTMVRINGKELLVEKTFMEGQLRSKSSNTPMLFMIRPEWVLIGPAVPSLPGADLTLIGSVLSRAFLGSFVRYWARVEGIASDLVIDDYQSRIHGILSGEIAIGMKQSDLYVFPSTEGEKAKINHPSMVI